MWFHKFNDGPTFVCVFAHTRQTLQSSQVQPTDLKCATSSAE